MITWLYYVIVINDVGHGIKALPNAINSCAFMINALFSPLLYGKILKQIKIVH